MSNTFKQLNQGQWFPGMCITNKTVNAVGIVLRKCSDTYRQVLIDSNNQVDGSVNFTVPEELNPDSELQYSLIPW